MFGCYNVEIKIIIDDLACGAVAFSVQASPREYLTSGCDSFTYSFFFGKELF
jgi:hypothetical protein